VPERDPEQTALSKKESELLKAIADRDGITPDEAATNLVKAALERMVRRRTGRGPAKVYTMKRR
jgi:hypothetical protein